MNANQVYQIAREFWLASGERTPERLGALIDRYANVYALSPEARQEAQGLPGKDWRFAANRSV